MLAMKEVTSLDQCRLVKVDHYRNTYEPLENLDENVEEILEGSGAAAKCKSRRLYDMVLEYKQPQEEFTTHVPGCKCTLYMFELGIFSYS